MNRITEYAKTLVAAAGAAASVLTALNVHAPWVSAVAAAATALGVYAVPNKPAAVKVTGKPVVTGNSMPGPKVTP